MLPRWTEGARWVALMATLGLAACERPPMEVEQGNFRGLAVETVTNPRIKSALLAENEVPWPVNPGLSLQGPVAGPPAGEGTVEPRPVASPRFPPAAGACWRHGPRRAGRI